MIHVLHKNAISEFQCWCRHLNSITKILSYKEGQIAIQVANKSNSKHIQVAFCIRDWVNLLAHTCRVYHIISLQLLNIVFVLVFHSHSLNIYMNTKNYGVVKKFEVYCWGFFLLKDKWHVGCMNIEHLVTCDNLEGDILFEITKYHINDWRYFYYYYIFSKEYPSCLVGLKRSTQYCPKC